MYKRQTEASCVIGSGVDAATRRQALHCLGQLAVVDIQRVLCLQGLQVGVDHGHGDAPFPVNTSINTALADVQKIVSNVVNFSFYARIT